MKNGMKWILELFLVGIGTATLMHAGVCIEQHQFMAYLWVVIGCLSFGFAGDIKHSRLKQQTGNFAD